MRLFAFVLLLPILLLSGCGDRIEEQARRAVEIEQGDECHLCGMVISRFPGPKGEAYEQGEEQVRKFCSTRDLMNWALDPENRHARQQIWVHDMSVVPWEEPDDEQFIDAEAAWYVVGSSRTGAMGPTLASFGQQTVAEQFASQYGGQVLAFRELTLENINQDGQHQMH
ncbi:nitrous oxide reductase accessory protein NosL [Zobellella taiwanensis]|jgi:copper chaperone NosL|uniref:Nitrous oxide reductase accessory protein NosL n=1 Tax=Zobellella taiwanensis TaxID=347535 RepID=A0A2P7QT69_9GAMM|nr:nitrous oxide reductase accessory protein NosL [Zobellella taiwanensis]PSJ41163.1 nitrous oxide reductase accessory protein NosL [Zobellella taiwanensis]